MGLFPHQSSYKSKFSSVGVPHVLLFKKILNFVQSLGFTWIVGSFI